MGHVTKQRTDEIDYWEIDGQSIPYLIRESKRAKYVRMEIHEKYLIIVRPSFVPVSSVKPLLMKRKKWILTHWQQVQSLRKAESERENTFLYLGGEYPLQVVKKNGVHPTLEIKDSQFVLTLPDDMPKEEEGGWIRAVMESWYRMQAKKWICRRVRELAEDMGLEVNRIFIKGQKTRWGSCSSKRNLNFNWRLIMCPPYVIDYIIIHELSHLTEMNHSPRFWALVASRCPHYRDCEKWLKENGKKIMGF